MPKPKDPESYDVAGTPYRQHEDPRAALEQAFRDYRTSIPSRNFTHRTNGNSITIYCHCHERGLGEVTRRASQVDAMSKAMDSFVKGLKKKYREMGAGTLDLSEIKGTRGYDLQKASLNDRWEIVYRRTYEVADLVGLPEKD
jgi:hypothetical protein